MSDIAVVTRERHAQLTWKRPASYAFAAGDPVIPLVSNELPRALPTMAVGFIENNGVYTLVAVQGLKQGQNRFVAGDGRWLGDYVPLYYRTYPFRLASNNDGGNVLCIDEKAGRVGDDASGEQFFLPDGTPAESLGEMTRLLAQLHQDRHNTDRACETLARHGLFQAWPLKAQDGTEVLEAAGLFRIAEAKLYELEPEALVEVRNSGGLMLAFAQLFSMQQVQKLGKLGAGTPTAPAAQAAPKLLDQNGIISFENL